MTFVYPLLLGGLVLAGLPVLLHFLIRKKPKTLLFPAFRFLLQKQRSNTRNLRLRHLLLLLLRIALVVLVCFALSRPRLFHETLGLSRERPVALVLVFDTSLSMDYKSGDLTRLDLAKKRSLELLDQLPEDCHVLILDASDPVAFAREDWHKSLEKARQRIQSLTTRPQSAPTPRAIDEAMRRFEKLDEPGTESMPRFVCVFSDRTKASWDTAPKRPAAENVKTLYFDVGIDEPIDVAITSIELPLNYQGEPRQTYTEGETIELRVVVKATGKDIENEVTCQIAGKKMPQAFQVKAGEQQTLTFKIDTAKMEPGFHQAVVSVGPADSLAFNNQRFATFQIGAKAPVLVLADDLKSTARVAFAMEVLGYAVTHKRVAENVNFNDFSAIFLVSVASPDNTLWDRLANYAKDGRGICVMPPGDDLQLNAYNSIAAKRLLPGAIEQKISSESGVEWDLKTNDLQHPFMRPFVGWLDRADVNLLRHPPRAEGYWQIAVPKDKVVVWYGDEKPAIAERLVGKGKVLVLTTPMDAGAPKWNDYQSAKTDFDLTLTWLCARHLVAEAENPRLNFEFGVAMPQWRNPEQKAFPKFHLTGETTEEIRLDDKNRWTGHFLTKPGNYTLEGRVPDTNNTETLWKFSVNVPGDESDLTRVAKGDIEASLGADSLVPQDARTSLFDSIGSHWTEPMELFPWLLIAVLFLLAVENLLANRFYRQEPAVENA